MRLRFTRRARIDLIEIWKYVAQDRPATATDILRRIDERCRNLKDMPKMGRARPELGPGVRSTRIARWIILYRLSEEEVVVSRVVDGARRLERALPRS